MSGQKEHKMTAHLRILKELQRLQRLRTRRIEAEIAEQEKERIMILQKIKAINEELKKPFSDDKSDHFGGK